MRTAALLTLALALVIGGSALAIERVAPSFYMLEGYGGYAPPIGTYTGTVLGDFEFGGLKLEGDAGDIYADGVSFGLAYGKLIRGHWLASAGIRYIRHDFRDTMYLENGDYTLTYSEKPTLSQWDLDIAVRYQFMDFRTSVVSPYLGLGVHPGISAATFRVVEAEYEGNVALSADFGFDVKVWSDPNNRAFVTLSSVNSWEFAASGTRPRHLNIGGGIKYFFKM